MYMRIRNGKKTETQILGLWPIELAVWWVEGIFVCRGKAATLLHFMLRSGFPCMTSS